MNKIFNILSSTSRIDKSRRKTNSKERLFQVTGIQNDDKTESLPSSNISSESTNKYSPEKHKQIHNEQVAAFRNKVGIYLSHSGKYDASIPDPITSFDELSPPSWWSERGKFQNPSFKSLSTVIIGNIEKGRWINPTPIQMQAIPSLLNRRDVLGCSPTGSGKSGSFIVPSLFLTSVTDYVFHNFSVKDKYYTDAVEPEVKKCQDMWVKEGALANDKQKIRALFLAPSRELASQLHREVLRIGDGKLNGIRAILLSKTNASRLCNPSSGSWRGIDILVSTPLRLIECLNGLHGKKINLESIRLVVLDEADRLLDAQDGKISNNKKENSGSAFGQTFLEQIDIILSDVPNTAVRALFSATIGSSVRHLAGSILRNHVDISIGQRNNTTLAGVNKNITQSLMFVGKEEGKLLAIRQIIVRGIKPPLIIFMQSKERAQALFLELLYDNARVDVIHAGISQSARDSAVTRFRSGDSWILICTDLCSRGMDFKAVNMVINYDLPTNGVNYVHRIGRCGRGVRKGESITLFTESDFEHLRNVANVMKLSGCDVPEWMLHVKMKKKNKKASKRIPPIKRRAIDSTPLYDKTKKSKKIQAIDANIKKISGAKGLG